MKNTIKGMYKSGLLYLVLWALTGLLGVIQLYYSPAYKQYIPLIEVKDEISFISTDLPFNLIFLFIFESIAVGVSMGIYNLFYWLFERRLPKIIKLVIFLLPLSLMLYWSRLALNGLTEDIKWGFYVFAFQDIIWFAYVIFVVQSYWMLVRR